MNTRISYFCQDAGNCKMLNETIISGSIAKHQIDIIMDCLENGENFIPRQVGLPEKRFGKLTENDHCWFKLQKSSFEVTVEEPDSDMTVDKLIGKFLKAKGNWKGLNILNEVVEKSEGEYGGKNAAEIILRIMEKEDVKPKELAERMGCVRQNVSQMLNRGTVNMRYDSFYRMAKALGYEIVLRKI